MSQGMEAASRSWRERNRSLQKEGTFTDTFGFRSPNLRNHKGIIHLCHCKPLKLW